MNITPELPVDPVYQPATAANSETAIESAPPDRAGAGLTGSGVGATVDAGAGEVLVELGRAAERTRSELGREVPVHAVSATEENIRIDAPNEMIPIRPMA